jgi:hypothetical protein
VVAERRLVRRPPVGGDDGDGPALGAGARPIAQYPAWPETNTYLLVANPSGTAAKVTIDLAPGTSVACLRTIAVAAHSRATFDLIGGCGFTSAQLGTGSYRLYGTITSDGPGIVVERATYTSSNLRFWTAGESTILTRLP